MLKTESSHGALMSVLALLLAWGIAPTSWAQAPDAGSGATVTTARNVYAAGQTSRTLNAVEGDFAGVGARVIVDRPVKGDALLAGGSVDVRSPVGDDVRASGGDIRIESKIGGELVAAGGSITLAQGAEVGQGGMLFGGTATLDGKVSGKLMVRAQKIVINGEVAGDANLVGEQIDLGPAAKISGNLVYTARSFNRAEGASVGGSIQSEETPAERRDAKRDASWGGGARSSGFSWLTGLMSYLGLLACAAAFLLLFPRFAEQAPPFVGSMPWTSMGIGFGAVFGVPVLVVLLVITLIGIPLGIVLLALLPGLLLMGYLVGVLFLTHRLQMALHKPAGIGFGLTMGLVAATLLIVMLIGRVPFVGGLLHFALVIAGIGACVLEWRHRRNPPASLASPAAA